ncbi:hypothetical protein ANN_27051 [Periplaneta americana]|uniref:Uncharacterized protein n=1 Tax=Periplaneta americana TaxID=6978 RepID=A0ABQ8RX10_PERAM|nr:hypothetical protein ANN_27051 [Periplaneta americana]
MQSLIEIGTCVFMAKANRSFGFAFGNDPSLIGTSKEVGIRCGRDLPLACSNQLFGHFESGPSRRGAKGEYLGKKSCMAVESASWRTQHVMFACTEMAQEIPRGMLSLQYDACPEQAHRAITLLLLLGVDGLILKSTDHYSIKIAAEQSIGYYENKKKKPWFDEDCCMVVERRKQAKLKFLQDPVEEKRDNYFNERREASRTLRNKKGGYLKEKLNEVETNSKNKNIPDLYKGIKEFKNGYQSRVNVIKDENGDLLADSPSILNRWKNYFAQLLNVHRPNRNDRDEIEIQTAEPFIPNPRFQKSKLR